MIRHQGDHDASDMMVSFERINTGLLNNHIHFLTGIIDNYSVEDAIKWIIYENTIKEQDKVLTIYINSEGGDLSSAFALIDIMGRSNFPVRTIGIGAIVSAAFLIFSCGTKGQRIIAKNTSIMCHQYTCGLMGKQHDLEAHIKEMELTKKRVQSTLVEASSLCLEDVNRFLLPPTDVWMTPEELVQYGIADIIS
jgi:ATP-dependent Clp protease protease subunit